MRIRIRKKLISFLLAVIMCFSCFTQAAGAAEAADNPYTFSMKASANSLTEGQVLKVDVAVEGAEFNDYSAKITYSTAHFELLNTSVPDSGGTITLHNVGNKVYPSGTTIATLYFGVKDITASATSRIKLESASADLSKNAVTEDAKKLSSPVNKNITLKTASSVKCSCTVDVDKSLWGEGETWGTVSVSPEAVSRGDTVTISAVAAAGYRFAGWRLYGETGYIYTDANVNVKLDYDMAFTAVFEPAAYDVDLSGVTVGLYGINGEGKAVVGGEASVLRKLPLSSSIAAYHLYKGIEADSANEIPLNRDGGFYMPEDTEQLTLTCSYLSGTQIVTESVVIDVAAKTAVTGVLTRMSATYASSYAGYFIDQSSVDFSESTAAYIDSATGQLMIYAGSSAYEGVMADTGSGDKDFNYESIIGESFSPNARRSSAVYGNSADTLIYVENFSSINIYARKDGSWVKMEGLEKLLDDVGANTQRTLAVYPFDSCDDMLVVYTKGSYAYLAYYDGETLSDVGTVSSANFYVGRLDDDRILVSYGYTSGSEKGICIYSNSTKQLTKAGNYYAYSILGTKGSSVFCKNNDGSIYLLDVDRITDKPIDTGALPNVIAMNYAVDGYIYAVTDGIGNMASWASTGAISLECPYNYIWRTADYGQNWEFVSYDNQTNMDPGLDAYDPEREGVKNDDTPATPDPVLYPMAVQYIVNPCEGVTLFAGLYGSMYAIYDTRTITFDTGEGSAVTAVTAKINSAVSAPANPTNGDKYFAGWYTDADCTEGSEYVFGRMPAKNITLYAKWTERYDPAYDQDQALRSLEEAYAGYTKSDYNTAEWKELTGYYEDGKTAINEAATKTAIYGALETAVNGMAGVTASNYGKINVTVTMEKFTVDGGYIIEPVNVSVEKGATAAKVITDLLKEKYPDMEQPWRMTGTVASGFYLAGVYDPTYLPDESKGQEQTYEGFLSEKDCGADSGWMICVNDYFINVSSAAWKLEDGDVMRWQYTCTGLGADIGADTSWGSGTPVTVADKNNLIRRIAEINEDKEAFFAEAEDNEEAYNAAMAVLAVIEASQDEVDAALAALGGTVELPEEKLAKEKESALAELQCYVLSDYREAEQLLLIEYRQNGIAAIEAATTVEEVNQALKDAVAKIGKLTTAAEYEAIENAAGSDEAADDAYEKTGKYLYSLGTPNVGSTGGEWAVIGLSRAGCNVSTEWLDGYYTNVLEYVKAEINANGQLHSVKSTDNSRIILALTAIGRDVTNVGGYNLLTALGDLDYLGAQGINGPIWALIALDSHDYRIPQAQTGGTQATRENIIEVILEGQLADGGWTFSGDSADPDMTGMAIQALAPYYLDESHTMHSAVKAAVDKALDCLSGLQNDLGGYSSWGTSNSESCVQVVVALTSLGINPDKDERFVKNGYSVLDALLTFAVEDGGFEHILGGGRDGMATEQAYYALASYYRLLDGKTSLYDMSDVEIMSEALNDAKDDAVSDLEAYAAELKETDYRGEEWKKIRSILETGKKSISEALSVDEVKEALKTAKAEIDEVPTAAELEQKEQQAEKEAFISGKPAVTVKATAYNKVQISWKAYANADSYIVYRSTNGTGWKKVTTVTGLSYTDTGVSGETTYYYTVKAQSSKWGETAYSKYVTDVKVKTPVDPARTAFMNGKPAVTAKAAAYNQVNITWKAYANATGYRVYRRTSGKTWTLLKEVTGLSYTDKTAVTGTRYYYTVKAVSTKWGGKTNSQYDKNVTAKTSLGTVSIKTASAGYSSVKVSWTKISGASGYKVYRATSKNGTYKLVKTITKGSTVSYTDSKLTTGKTYYYKVRAYRTVNGKNVYGQYSAIKSAKPVPAAVTISSVKNSKSRQAAVTWKKVSGASGYVVYRATSKNGTYKAVRTVKSGITVKFTNTGLKKGTTYYYKVRAYRTVNGKKVYGSYSAAKSVKITK